MTKGGTQPTRIYQADLVGLFCHPTAFQELQLGSSNISLRKGCLLDERTDYGSVSHNHDPLTIGELYLKLRQKVGGVIQNINISTN
jgi:hypothetical protein